MNDRFASWLGIILTVGLVGVPAFVAIVSVVKGQKQIQSETNWSEVYDCKEGSAGCCRPRLQKDQSWEIECEAYAGQSEVR